MATEIPQKLKEWVTHISTPVENIGGFSVCPYAKGTNYEIQFVEVDEIDPPPWFFELIIFVLSDDLTFEDLKLLSEKYNKLFPELIFLPDHKNHDTFINEVQTNNGKFNLLLCQYRSELDKARNKLLKTNYYQYWTEDYLKEILNT